MSRLYDELEGEIVTRKSTFLRLRYGDLPVEGFKS